MNSADKDINNNPHNPHFINKTSLFKFYSKGSSVTR